VVIFFISRTFLICNAVERFPSGLRDPRHYTVGKTDGGLPAQGQKTGVDTHLVRAIGSDEPYGSIPDGDPNSRPPRGGVNPVFPKGERIHDLSVNRYFSVSPTSPARREKVKGAGTGKEA
jgi:hypothetical protein